MSIGDGCCIFSLKHPSLRNQKLAEFVESRHALSTCCRTKAVINEPHHGGGLRYTYHSGGWGLNLPPPIICQNIGPIITKLCRVIVYIQRTSSLPDQFYFFLFWLILTQSQIIVLYFFLRIDCRWGGLILQNKIFLFLFLFYSIRRLKIRQIIFVGSRHE